MWQPGLCPFLGAQGMRIPVSGCIVGQPELGNSDGNAARCPTTGDWGQSVPHYRILSKIGGGGRAVVYEAECLKLGRHVALKFLPGELADCRTFSSARQSRHPAVG